MGLMSKFFGCVLVFYATTSVAWTPSWQAKVSPWLLKQFKSQKTETEKQTVLIYLQGEASLQGAAEITNHQQRTDFVFKKLVSHAHQSQSRLIEYLKSQKLAFRSYYISNMIAVDFVSEDQVKDLSSREEVLRIVGNPAINTVLPQTTSVSLTEPMGPGNNLVYIGATKVWDEFKARGEGIVVAGQDTGTRWDHKALKSQYRGWDGVNADHTYSWHDSVHKSVGGKSSCGYDKEIPCDDHDHGTHTIGTIVGDDGQGNQIGLAPQSKWVSCRNMDDGIGTPEQYTECFQWFLAPWPQKGDPEKDARPDLAVHVVNNSWGCNQEEGCEGGEFERTLKVLKAAGIYIVASAGNEGPSCSTIKFGPAFHGELLTSVGAIDHRSGNIASFSSRGPSTFNNLVGPDVSAPGVDVRSCVKSGGYAEFGWSGTSMAGPHVAGLVALMWSAAPKLIGKIDETEEIIRQTSTPKTSSQTCKGVAGSARPNNTFGYGIINAYEAVKAAKALEK